MASVEEQATANANTHLVAQVKEIGAGTTALLHAMGQMQPNAAGPVAGEPSAATPAPQAAPPGEAQGDAMPPPEALKHLKAGRHTSFANGSTWTLGADGKPVKVKA
jgi:hypothetical protein